MKAGLGSGANFGPDSQGESGRTPFVAPSVEEVARLFPQLEVLGFIGQGGMGAVYRARQKELDRVVALKILPPGIGKDPAFADRFTREARALAKLNHPGVVTLYEFGRADGLFFFLMEFVDGVNLRQLLTSGRLSAREALAIVPQICDALQYAHDQGIVHRDIKPENILLDRQGRVKVADFGLAKLVGTEGEPSAAAGAVDGSAVLTEAGKVMGTPQYMAPEQREHPADVDHRADIYSLGVVFYQMLTGELPGQPIAPPSHTVRLDVRLDEVVLRALEKEPELRYQHVSQVKSAVETITHTPSSASASPSQTHAINQVTRLAHNDATHRSFLRRQLRWAWLAAVAVCAILGLVFWLAHPTRVTITGRVIDNAGHSLPDITVRAIPLPFSLPWLDNLKPPKDKREFTAVTDSEGRYRLEGLSAEPYRMADTPSYAQEYDLEINAGPFARQKIRVSTRKGNLQDIDFVLEPEAILAGRAVDTVGSPLAHRSVRLAPQDQLKEGHGVRQNVLPRPQETDGLGTFRFEQVPPGAYALEIPAYADRGFEVPQRSTNSTLLIRSGETLGPRDFFFESQKVRGVISGRVVNAESGDSIEVFSVKVVRLDSAGAGLPLLGRAGNDGAGGPHSAALATSWKHGSFLIEGLSPGLATLEISADGCARETARVSVLSGQTTNVTIALKREGIVRGQATRNGKPCGHGYVNLRLAGEAPEAGIDTQTDSRGFYQYRGLPAGEYLVRICIWLREDTFSAQLTDLARARVETGKDTRLDLEFGRSATLEGRFQAPDKTLQWVVTVEDASPPAASLPAPDRRRATAWKLERTGQYSIEGLAPGTYTVTAECLRNDEARTVVLQKSKTISVKDGEKAQVDFDLR